MGAGPLGRLGLILGALAGVSGREKPRASGACFLNRRPGGSIILIPVIPVFHKPLGNPAGLTDYDCWFLCLVSGDLAPATRFISNAPQGFTARICQTCRSNSTREPGLSR